MAFAGAQKEHGGRSLFVPKRPKSSEARMGEIFPIVLHTLFVECAAEMRHGFGGILAMREYVGIADFQTQSAGVGSPSRQRFGPGTKTPSIRKSVSVRNVAQISASPGATPKAGEPIST